MNRQYRVRIEIEGTTEQIKTRASDMLIQLAYRMKCVENDGALSSLMFASGGGGGPSFICELKPLPSDGQKVKP